MALVVAIVNMATTLGFLIFNFPMQFSYTCFGLTGLSLVAATASAPCSLFSFASFVTSMALLFMFPHSNTLTHCPALGPPYPDCINCD